MVRWTKQEDNGEKHRINIDKEIDENYKHDENKKRAEVSDMKYFSKKNDKFIYFFIYLFIWRRLFIVAVY